MLDSEAEFEVAARRHRRELHVHCYRMVGNFEEAEDLVQETFARAWNRRDTLERREWLRAWLYRIATNACLDAIKRDGRRVPSLASFGDVPWLQPYPDQLLEEVAPADEEPDAALVARETIELAFLAAIQLLPARQRAVLVLREVLDWPARDVAEHLDMGVAAVNSALQRARATLREHLPHDRREDWTARETTETEARLLAGYIATHESGDSAAALAMVTEDIRITMPPHPMAFQGIDALRPLLARAHESGMGEWRLLPTRANRHPAAACYLRAPGDDRFRAFKLDVLRVRGDKIAEFTTFSGRLIPAFGLPEVLPEQGA
ncbi:RNA polymerase subunit sigma-70 [Conexibacter sp. SYSU D00693]|uniref:RNA polymerase subunit sigma-70 n=1 Tax=Conexibacter sp. SYSU D00693 TaxID=2812560 RepID=UPI001F122276|nr:RNA polymerase subunit sigma-70 [Conexibacter sp. SYSU D00693]